MSVLGEFDREVVKAVVARRNRARRHSHVAINEGWRCPEPTCNAQTFLWHKPCGNPTCPTRKNG